MLNFFNKHTFKNSSKPLIKTDIHSHLIPEIDDGCPDIETSIKIIQQMKKLGYEKLIITPHIMINKYPNSSKIIKNGLYELRGMLRVKNIDIQVEASAEYYFDEHFIALIEKKELLVFGKNYVLFELPYTTRPKELEKVILRMIALNFKPVLAHPERYRFLKEIRDFLDLKALNIFFQVNVNSIGGHYGKEVQKKALMLSQKGMIDFIGSDIHHQKQMDDHREVLLSNRIEMLFRNNKILNDTI